MGFLCCFPGCTNKAALWSPHSFHRIPLRNKNMRQLWLVALSMDMDLPPAALKHLRVCSSHFSEDDFLRPVSDKSRRCGLKSSAVPTHQKQNCSVDEAMVSSNSTDDEENTQECAEKSTLSGNKHCYMHITSVQHEEVCNFTAKRWDTYRRSLQVLLKLKGECQDVAQMYTQCLNMGFDDIPNDAGYHTTCYSQFTDKKATAKVERHLAREREDGQEEDHDDLEAAPSTSSTILNPKKKPSPIQQTTGSSPVLPAICIICKINEKRVTKAGKRQRERLSKAATFTAGQLLSAAEIKEDQSILLYLKDRDCVALEVQYHKSCFLQYTWFLTKFPNPQKED